jgi:large subunit ribosomal protein L5
VSTYIPRLSELYKKKKGDLSKKLSLKNIMQVPKLEKIVVNIGHGQAVQNVKLLEAASAELALITGQKPVLTRAKKSIAGFKLREGMPIGCSVTLRRTVMFEFLDRLINLTIPRIRDFRGYSLKAFDGRGNYSLGIKEQIVFPEIDYDKVKQIKGLGITIVTTAKDDIQCKELLEMFDFPFRKK